MKRKPAPPATMLTAAEAEAMAVNRAADAIHNFRRELSLGLRRVGQTMADEIATAEDCENDYAAVRRASVAYACHDFADKLDEGGDPGDWK